MTHDSNAQAAGVFTAAILDGLSSAAAPDGAVFLSALASHVQERVATWLRTPEAQSIAAAQRPVVRIEGADFAVLPSRSSAPESAGA